MSDTLRPLTMGGKLIPVDLDEDLIRAVVYRFYDYIRADPLLAQVFNQRISAAEWPVHLEKMCDFWSSSLLRTDRYNGRPLPPHLNIPELDDAHFERWLSLFHQTVDELCEGETRTIFFDLARRIARSFRMAVAFHRGEDSLSITPLKADSIGF